MTIASIDRFLLCLAWITYLGMVIFSGGLSSFIAQWQHVLVISATAAFVLLMLGSWWGTHTRSQTAAAQTDHHQHETRSPTDQLIQTLVHCLPLFLISALGVTSLGGHAFNIAAATSARQEANPADSVSENNPLNDLREVRTLQGPVTIADIYTPKTIFPAEVEIVGMTYRPKDSDYERLPGTLSRESVPLLLYRYQITCCAADASPIFLALIGFDPLKYPNDTWVTVKGRLTPPSPPNNIGRLDVISVVPTATPSEQYLSRPLY